MPLCDGTVSHHRVTRDTASASRWNASVKCFSRAVAWCRLGQLFVREVVESVTHELLRSNALALSRVPTRMVLQRTLLVEALATEARERPVASVDEHVTVQLGLAQESRTAVPVWWSDVV